MALTAGTRLGAYEVGAVIGAGGMGEVYRAHDTNLRRDVAIKILPDLLAADPDQVARFAREAQVLAALNHPHIASVYGLERSGPVTAIVMELVDGETLAERLARGRMPVREVLDVSAQILDALDAAHERGIVHRDLKPANIKLTSDGQVKVLDFGLAKSGVVMAGSEASLMNSPTIAAGLTTAGLILGTAAYMAPEQARGRPVDKRADIWAFGCVLFEMLASRPVFDGSDTSEIIAGVIKSEVPWNALPADTPSRIRRLLERCLEKDPRRRMRDAADARFEIEESTTSPDRTPDLKVGPTAARTPLLPWLLAGIAGLAAIVLGAMVLFRPLAPAAQPIWFPVLPPEADFTRGIFPAISPDGRSVAFTAPDTKGTVQLWVKHFDNPTATLVPGGENTSLPFWSPDGRSLGIFTGGKLRRVDLDGGKPQELADAANPRGGCWNKDNVILFAPVAYTGISRVNASGGTVTAVTTIHPDQQELEHSAPFCLPDARHFLFSRRLSIDGQSGIYIRSIDQDDAQLVTAEYSRGEYAAGYLFFGRERTLFAQPFDLGTRHTTGTPFRVADNIGVAYGNLAQYAFTTSPTGTLAYWAGRSYPLTQIQEVDRAGRKLRTVGPPGEYYSIALSPDGQTLAAERRDAERNAFDVWTIDTASGGASRFTANTRAWRWNGVPIWSPDGKKILYTEFTEQLLMRDLRGDQQSTRLAHHLGSGNWPVDWSPDGKYVVLVYNQASGSDIGLVPIDGVSPPLKYAATPFSEGSAAVSPDGQWLAFSSNDSGRDEVFIDSFPTPERRLAVSSDGGRQTRWRHDGHELYYMSPEGHVMAVDVTRDASGLHTSQPHMLFDLGSAELTLRASNTRRLFDPIADGSRFFVNLPVEDKRPGSINVLTNFAAAFEKLK